MKQSSGCPGAQTSMQSSIRPTTTSSQKSLALRSGVNFICFTII
eukprot:CAMPEP_0196574948 /NCGR_PEP_ID=MMETSP1081-20130531/4545_1 /TAXON_ID=36882 /ORGANISM="Pyramimonas amylifera, Strain CCMP720" /LENGTH=43 /DNA_ID= /DNA_START= /DNA_END= /DNA_ORIENTATION=